MSTLFPLQDPLYSIKCHLTDKFVGAALSKQITILSNKNKALSNLSTCFHRVFKFAKLLHCTPMDSVV